MAEKAKKEVRISEERLERFAYGEITMAEFMGMTQRDLYAIAELGYQLMREGKMEKARTLYEALVVADPYDSVFHTQLGAIHHKMGQLDKAVEQYSEALKFNFANVDAYSGRGEILFTKGKLSDAAADLNKAIELDPKGNIPSSVRARAFVLAISQVAKKSQAARAE